MIAASDIKNLFHSTQQCLCLMESWLQWLSKKLLSSDWAGFWHSYLCRMVADFENTPINSEIIFCEERILFNDMALALCIHLE